jgi:hypothetical protein
MELGLTYEEMWLSENAKKRKTSGFQTTKVIEKPNGLIIHRFSHYVTLVYIRLYKYQDGFSKAVVKVDKNYHPRYQYTLYFDKDGREIKSPTNSTRAELAYWKKLRAGSGDRV